MSDVVAPSFFPTPVEIAGGLRWVRAHPVVATAAAAAAATAVSVFSFLQARADDSDEELLAHMEQLQLEQRAVEGDEDDEEDEEEEDAGDERRDAVRALRPRRSRPWAHRERLPGALDCAFVGKALAEDVYSSTDSDASSSPTRARDTSFGELDADEPATLLLPTRRPADVEDTSASPQWGWYVSTTPPEDYYP